MTIRIPIARIRKLVGTLVKVVPGGITKEEAQTLGQELVDLGLEILLQLAPEGEIQIPVHAGTIRG